MLTVALLSCLCLNVRAAAALLPTSLRTCSHSPCRTRSAVIRGAVTDHVLTDEDAHSQRRVWALIYNYRSDNEGIYTQSIDGQEHVLTWQAEEDAARYGDMLTDAQDFPEGTAVEMETSTLLEFCKAAGYVPCLIPSSSVIIPPDANVEEFEWTPEELEEGSLDAQQMTEENLSRRRKELEVMLGKDVGPDADYE
mmetsp:Transcript_5455/g.10744  ORF Transcript_5455/g.10744 Transcript_5455/m.10744 type:complete len:195 (-) Transcript_5455:161-745(-)